MAAFFVQFPHPGPEHNPRTDEVPWNTANHRRKFLVAPGRYHDGDGCLGEAKLTFWGEWEAPARVERRWPASGRMPRALHRPYWAEPTASGFRQNTDPWVFGKRMIYSNCKQVTGTKRSPTSMQRLTRGSVICFGSTIDHQFCVDTVFVVDSSEPWTPSNAEGLRVDDAFMTCTARSLATWKAGADASFTLYRGATADDPVEGMFSFVPARQAELDDSRFPRPPVKSKFIKPSNRQSTWGSKRPLSIETVCSSWQELRDQVLHAGLLLGVWFRTPDRKKGDVIIGGNARQRC